MNGKGRTQRLSRKGAGGAAVLLLAAALVALVPAASAQAGEPSGSESGGEAPGQPLVTNMFYETSLRQALADIAAQTGTIIVEDWVPPAAVAHPKAVKAVGSLFLHWSPVVQDTAGCPEAVNHYVVYRDAVPDFIPGAEDSLGIALDTTFLDTTAAVDNTSVHHFYAIQTVDQGNNKSVPSNTVGEFDRELINSN